MTEWQFLYHFHPTWQLSLVSLSIILNILFKLLQKVTRYHSDWHYWNISCNKLHQERWEKKPSKSNIYQHLQKDEKHGELEYETFVQVIKNLLLSETIFKNSDPDSFYISNDDIIIQSFNDITLLRQDINKKENKIRDLNHCLEILS